MSMEKVDELFRKFVSSYEAGDSDPRPFLSQAKGLDREELIALIDAYLTTAPGRVWDEAAFRGSAAEGMVEPLTKALAGTAGTWPALLPELRHRAKVKRSVLVARLASALGVSESEELVSEYYHGMEQGTVDARGVSNQVLDALGEILHTKGATLRRAGRSVAGFEFKGQQPTFARIAPGNVVLSNEDADLSSLKGMDSPTESRRPNLKTDQRVDELFTGGS